ncbi:DUF362 domain-containing protein [Fictibacillus fluitans]|uniref:DUF362 domain-containing protein n=1 Tax=Fictibacillus fluitans TaxID=3058422 RepID=A0ABT8I051_9BACL|nr:DUF362 domain-containing protein [Fictibacillus sp. NE201]MDN4526408.1 DUF362 domain-containing protein [Fictibacillus sp. NE201]
MVRKYARVPVVSSPLGINSVDFNGSPISGVRMDVFQAYGDIPILLQKFINDKDNEAWKQITYKIDYIYSNLNYALRGLNSETDFSNKVQSQVRSGKKLLFKPNIVNPIVIDFKTHGEGPAAKIVTEWTLIAALMRWFHDNLHISYHQMAIGEGSTSTFVSSSFLSKAENKKITTEAIIEGRSGDFFGGWGFFFVRKYLAERHPASHEDDPMKGYEESVEGRFIPPGRTQGLLMVYDLNKLHDGTNRGRAVRVPGGTVFKEITLNKIIAGGDPQDNQDLSDYPGCVLINVPKTKLHDQDLITNAIKNLGIGLYPTQKYSWYTAVPSLKEKLPHSPWVLEMDPDTNLPFRDENGKYVAINTDGLSGVQSDLIRAVQNQGVLMIHIVDGLNITNVSHNANSLATRVPEGYVWSSLDCVALDLFCARYCFKTVPMDQARKLQDENRWPTEFIHHSPEAHISGKNIVTQSGLDSPLFRYDLYRFAEKRGVGQQKYYVVGWDTLTRTPMASVQGHLGRIHNTKFIELITDNMYYNLNTILQDFQKGIFSYAKASDQLTGTSLFKELIDTFDENFDGVIDYDEKGRGDETASLAIQAYALDLFVTQAYGDLRMGFTQNSLSLKYSNVNWNRQGHDFMRESALKGGLGQAYLLSKSEDVKADLFISGMSYGNGMWPSWQTVVYIRNTNTIYGSQSPQNISLGSLYGNIFQYADKVLHAGTYTGSISQDTFDASDIEYGNKVPDPGSGYHTSPPESINKYFQAVSKGAAPLGFTFFVPIGYGRLEGVKIPNVEETNDPAKILTVQFRFEW